MADYITPSELRSYIGSDTSNQEDLVQAACTTASRVVEQMCGRTFNAETSTTTLKRVPSSYWCVELDDDIYTTTSLVLTTDDAADGSYSTTWTINTDFVLEPVNQRQGPISGYPWTSVRAVGSKTFPMNPMRPWSVQIVAKLGWAAVPAPVKQACLMAGAQLFKLKDAPDGFVGLDGWGPTQVRENRFVRATLGPYMRNPIAVA